MTGRLTGKVAIVTGAASGFGRATALLFAAEGARVVVADIDEPRALQTVEQIAATGGDATMVIGDASEGSVADAMVTEAVGRYGAVHVLVNNAGIAQGGQPGRTWDAVEEVWDKVIKTNLRSVYVCSRAAIPAMYEAGNGSIINVASIAASVSVGGSAYAASKGGMLSYTRLVAVEVAPTIRINCVSPGYMRTPMSTGEREGWTAEQAEQRMSAFASFAPMERVGSAEDIAQAALFFASDESSFITGRELVVDGGHLVTSPRQARPPSKQHSNDSTDGR
jgi:NAD(P)-dependent dehydrogenase (short-subunit alcohol dehydrogenase family)